MNNENKQRRKDVENRASENGELDYTASVSGRRALSTNVFSETRLGASYQEYLQTQNTALFVEQVRQSYTQATLLRLTGAAHPHFRRAAILALTYLGDYEANDVFGRLLHDEDQIVRLLADIGIKSLWPRAGNAQQRKQLREMMRLNAADQYSDAVRIGNELIDESPDFAEAINQRGVAYFGLKMFDESISDSSCALDLNPFHFGAAVGMGHAYLHKKEFLTAIDCFELAMEINPTLVTLRKTIVKITEGIC